MREFLSDNKVPFDDRNIRRNDDAREELAQRSAELVVPQLFWREHHVVGFDPGVLQELVDAYREGVT